MDIENLKQNLWNHLGSSIAMLENAIKMCPPELWDTPTPTLFWHNAYHAVFFTDYNVTTDPMNFAPPAPFSLSELDPSGLMPERTYTPEELLEYLAYAREKWRKMIASFTDESINNIWKDQYRELTMLEATLSCMRHVQHHTAQLNLLLRHGIDNAPRWVGRAPQNLYD